MFSITMAAILDGQFAQNRNSYVQGSFWHKIGPNPFRGSWNIVIFMFLLFLVTTVAAILDDTFP